MKRVSMIALIGAGTFALAACGGDEIDEAETSALEAEPTTVAEFDPMSRDYTLSEEQQALRGEFDETTFQEEYRGYRGEIMEERDEEIAEGGDAGAGTEARGTPSPASTRDAITNMRVRSDMSWSYLDRNSDGQLSVAEYAIWAIPLDPTQPAPNDETAPYLTSEEANKAADSFFYYDTDGDTYLSQREFTAARSGDMIS